MWKCKECGMIADSKCVGQRTIFYEDQIEALLTRYIKVRYEEASDDKAAGLVIKMVDYGQDPNETQASRKKRLLEQLYNTMRAENFFPIKTYWCNHDSWWILNKDGICELGHTHEQEPSRIEWHDKEE